MKGYKVPQHMVEGRKNWIVQFAQYPKDEKYIWGMNEVIEDIESLPLEELDDNWHTGKPTEEGDYLLALCFENLKLDVAHFKDGVFVSYHDHIIASSYIRLWQKIEPYRG